MNVTELTAVISKRFFLSKAFSREILDTMLETIREELKHNRLVRLRNFGTFQARKSHGKKRAKFSGSKNFFKS